MEKIRLGVLGCSNFLRKRIIDAVSKSSYAKIVCLSSRDLEKAKKWAEEFKIENYDSYEGLLKRKDIDAVYIALPVGLHKEWAIKAAETGKHVLCEKSLAVNLEEVREIVDSCKKNNMKLAENLMVEYHPQHRKVSDIINNGDLGKLFSFKSSFGFPNPGKDDIRYKRELGGGILNDVACYLIFMSRFLFKEEPISVFCSVNLDKEKLIDTSGSFLLEFPDNKKALGDFGYGEYYQNNYSLWGDKGLIKVNNAYSIPDDKFPDIDFMSDSENKKIESLAANQYTRTIDAFCLDILGNRESKFGEILNQARVMDALRLSAKLGKKVLIDEIEKEKSRKVVLTSGFFDPLHVGHVELFRLSKELGDKLIVVVNNDEQVFLKRGKKPIMDQEQRKEVLESIKYIDEVIISIDKKDTCLFETLRLLKPDIFAKGGDRFANEIPEGELCKELGIKIVDGLGEKRNSSRNYYNAN
jgi:rfaE bifunctional protein nucleotidyltransferase chain/domain